MRPLVHFMFDTLMEIKVFSAAWRKVSTEEILDNKNSFGLSAQNNAEDSCTISHSGRVFISCDYAYLMFDEHRIVIYSKLYRTP